MKTSSSALTREIRTGKGMPVNVLSEALRKLVEELETDIVFGRLHPRERLVEDELVARFGAKRHIIRQVLVELERMGLVSRPRNRGATVADFTPDEVEQIYGVRRLLETGAAAQIPTPLNAVQLDGLRTIQRKHDQAVESGNSLGAFRANNDFHRLLFSTCGNAYLSAAISDFAQKTHVIRSFSVARPEYLRQARDEHWAMIKALKSGDRKQLVSLCSNHLDISKLPYIEAYRTKFGSQ
ncbi:MAG: GntR family transcriptional regulator [Casimicrobiaceae bacterium]